MDGLSITTRYVFAALMVLAPVQWCACAAAAQAASGGVAADHGCCSASGQSIPQGVPFQRHMPGEESGCHHCVLTAGRCATVEAPVVTFLPHAQPIAALAEVSPAVALPGLAQVNVSPVYGADRLVRGDSLRALHCLLTI